MKRIIVQQKFEFDEAEFEILKEAMFTMYQTEYFGQPKKREVGMKLLREMENINV